VCICGTALTLTNNTLAGNIGIGLKLQLGDKETYNTVRLYNNLFWDNFLDSDNTVSRDLWIDNDGDGDYLPTPVTLLANNFDQSEAGFKITLPITIDPSNLNKVDPLFVDASTDDFTSSPAHP
jgi:hypothetical protein